MNATNAMSPRDLCAALSSRLQQEFEAVLPRGTTAVLLDAPDHDNAGDSAILLGELAALRRAGVRVVHASSTRGYDPEAVRRHAGATVLLHGGGNFGDVWPRHQQLRERVVGDFPDRRIVVLPQSLQFADSAAVERAAAVFAAHERLLLMVRDAHSLALGREVLQVTTTLVPDAAFALPYSPTDAGDGVLWLRRADHEAVADELPALPARVEDWRCRSGTASFGHRLHGRVSALLDGGTPPGSAARRMLAGDLLGLELRARARLRSARRQLAAASLVVSERMHGHILCLLMDKPHIVIDNSYGKTRRLVEAWTAACTATRLVGSRTEAAELLVAGQAGGGLR